MHSTNSSQLQLYIAIATYFAVAIKPYDELCDRSQRRKRKEVGDAVKVFLGELEEKVGIIPLRIELESTKQKPISIPLNGSRSSNKEQEEPDNHITEKILYVLMKYNISMQGYHDLSMIVDSLPRSNQVLWLNTYSYKL